MRLCLWGLESGKDAVVKTEKEKEAMRQLLYGTTALVGATALAAVSAQAAEPISITTFGWVNEYVGFSSVDEGSGEDFNAGAAHLDAQVNFKGATTLDNGIEVGVRLEIEMPNPGGLDETFAYLKGDFGELRAGNHNSAGYAMLSGVPSVGVPINSGWQTYFIAPPDDARQSSRDVSLSTGIDFSNDDNTILYFSPRFSGLQLGVSFTPNATKSNDPNGLTDTTGEDYYNGVAIAGTFVESFNGIDIDFGVSYGRAEAGDATEALGGDDIEQVMVSFNVGFSGFTIGGQYANQLEGRLGSSTTTTFDTTAFVVGPSGLQSCAIPGGCTSAEVDAADAAATSTSTSLTSNEGEAWGIGATYSTGPWTVGGSYFLGEVEDDVAVPGDDEYQAIVGAVSYELGPGITTDFSVLWADWDTEDGVSQDGWAGVIGLSVGF